METIDPLLQREAFDPEAVQAIYVAFENTCAAVQAAKKSHLVREAIAARIIALALTGERDPTTLYLQCMKMYQDSAPEINRVATERGPLLFGGSGNR